MQFAKRQNDRILSRKDPIYKSSEILSGLADWNVIYNQSPSWYRTYTVQYLRGYCDCNCILKTELKLLSICVEAVQELKWYCIKSLYFTCYFTIFCYPTLKYSVYRDNFFKNCSETLKFGEKIDLKN